MNALMKTLTLVAAGAAAMYYLDPETGRRRRALVRDDVLHERIRSRLGREVARPGDVEVEVNDGHVVLSGSASAEEMDSLARAVAGIDGVNDVENRLQ